MERLDYVGHLPEAAYFDPEKMSEKRRYEFYAWHKRARVAYGDRWELKKELEAYCMSDCTLLARGLLQYRSAAHDGESRAAQHRQGA